MATATHETTADKGGKLGGKRIQCVVVTPERTLFDELVDSVVLPLFDGELGVLPGRTPLIGRLGFGELRTKSAGVTKRYFIDGGFAQVRDDVVTVLTVRAVPADKIDTAAAGTDLEQAKTQRALNEHDQAERTKTISRARAQLRVAAHR